MPLSLTFYRSPVQSLFEVRPSEPDPKEAFLDYIGEAVDLIGDERDRLRRHLRLRTLAKGETLVREGERCHEVAFVGHGVLRVYFLSDGDDRTAYFVTEGHTVSDYESFLAGEPSKMNIEAIEDAVLVVLNREGMRWAYEELRHGERLGRLIAERLFVATHRRLASFYLDTAEARYRRLVDEHPGLVQRVPQHLIASYVGVRPQSLSRIRRRIAESIGPPREGGGRSSPG